MYSSPKSPCHLLVVTFCQVAVIVVCRKPEASYYQLPTFLVKWKGVKGLDRISILPCDIFLWSQTSRDQLEHR
jgi:hypothetical protein